MALATTRVYLKKMRALWKFGLALSLALAACRDGAGSFQDPAVLAGEAVPVNNFSWVIDGQLAGMADPTRSLPEEHLQFLEEEHVEFLVSLTEDGTDPDAAGAHGITVLHIPVADFTAPTMDQLQLFVWVAQAAIEEERAVGVHCTAGLGRTGTFLAAYFVAEGMTAKEAIEHVRSIRPHSVETPTQYAAVEEFEALLASAE